MKFTVKGLQTLKGMGYINLVVPVPLSEEEEINKIDPEKQYVVEVKQWRKGRSNDANKYAWVLCQKIAEKLSEESFHSKMFTGKRSGNVVTAKYGQCQLTL